MKTVADLKRKLVVGQGVVLDSFKIGGNEQQHKYKNVLRYVVHTQSNSYCLHPDKNAPRSEWCWGDWPAIKELTFDKDDGGFTINDGAVTLHYRFCN